MVVVCAVSGCVYGHHYDRPARLQLGVRTRQLHTPVAPPDQVAFRTTEPTSTAATESHEAVMGSAQFTMQAAGNLYLGGEVEAGTLETPGSNAAGAYAIAGVEGKSRFGALAAEITGGWRTMRSSISTEDVDSFALEPRVRGDIWLGPQLTLGGLAGATLGENRSWMAGVFVAFHSHAFGTSP
jgi:hypothetical protein